MTEWNTKKEHLGSFTPLCVEYLASGDPLLLQEMSEYQLSGAFSFHSTYIMKFTHDIGALCDSLSEQLLLQRLETLMQNPVALDFFKTKLLQHPDIKQDHRKSIDMNLIATDARRLFWFRFLCEFRQSMELRQAEMFHDLKRALAVKCIAQEPEHARHLASLNRLGVEPEALDEFWELLFRTTPFWLGTRDYKFYDLVERTPGGIDRLLNCKMNWGYFCNRFTADIFAPSATPQAMKTHVKMSVEGVLRGALPIKSTSGRFERFLGSNKMLMYPSVRQTVDEGFMRLSALEVDKYPALLELLSHYLFYPEMLPHFETCEQFIPGLKLAAPLVAAKIICASAMKDQLLHSYPDSRENVLVMDLGL